MTNRRESETDSAYSLTPQIVEQLEKEPDFKINLGNQVYSAVVRSRGQNGAGVISVFVRTQEVASSDGNTGYQVSVGKTEDDALRGIGLDFRMEVLRISQREKNKSHPGI